MSDTSVVSADDGLGASRTVIWGELVASRTLPLPARSEIKVILQHAAAGSTWTRSTRDSWEIQHVAINYEAQIKAVNNNDKVDIKMRGQRVSKKLIEMVPLSLYPSMPSPYIETGGIFQP